MGFDDGLQPDSEARVMTARCGDVAIINVYVPNGRSLDHEQYQYKLSWLDRLTNLADGVRKEHDAVILAGDFNIAPADIDVYSPAAFAGATHVSPPERAVVQRFVDNGWQDVVRGSLSRRRPDVLVVGLPPWRLPRGPRHAHRSRPCHGTGRRAGGVVRHRPQRPQGSTTQRSRAGHRGSRVNKIR